ncbi:MAG TPA: hypothetical protein VHL53_08275 [Acidimicrobiia bacterium]|nr:hypothetical protein [Acidimicrobiia bacterium]
MIAAALAFFLLGVPLICWAAVRAARDMDARGEAGWRYGVLILVFFPAGLMVWLAARSRRPLPEP